MVLMTMVGRAADGLPLAASMQADEQVRCILFAFENETVYSVRDSLSE